MDKITIEITREDVEKSFGKLTNDKWEDVKSLTESELRFVAWEDIKDFIQN